jgi:hypothetical protein
VLLAALAEEGFKLLDSALDEVDATSSQDTLEALLGKGMVYARFALHHPAHFRVMFGPEPLDKRAHPTLHEAATAAFMNLHRTVLASQASGQLDDSPPDVISVTAWSAVHGVSALLVDGVLPDVGELDAPAEELVSIVCMSAVKGFVRV